MIKIGIIGAGAMGSLFGYHFIKAGLDTITVEKESSVVTSLSGGLTVSLSSGDEVVLLHVTDDPLELKKCTHIFLFVKSYATEDAIAMIAHCVNNEAIIISLQNGIGNYERISRHIAIDKIVYGTTTLGAAKKGPAEVIPGGSGSITIGGHDPAAVESVNKLLRKAGLSATITSDPQRTVWTKAVINAGINPIAAMLEIPNGALLTNRYAAALQEIIVSEAANAARGSGIDLDTKELLDQTREVCSKTCSNLCSMLQDLKSGRKTEIDSITGEIIKLASKQSIQVPFNEAVYLFVKAKELTSMGS